MSEFVTKLNVLGQDNTIFDTDMQYIIPLYQRAFAWEDKQLTQLVEDIDDVAEDAHYYMGALIVARQGNMYEVVDGQQRLTSLFLLLNCLGIQVPQTLKFACRDKSNYTLKHIQDLLQENRSNLDMDAVEEGIRCGTKILLEKLKELEKEQKTLDSFKEKLKKVIMYRIEVPENTDLNRYFEIMNTRGEQLEQHDILKAILMSCLDGTTGDEDKEIFAKIWNACSDMTGYVQMHFVSKNNVDRETIFGSYWNDLPSPEWSDYEDIGIKDRQVFKQCQIQEIIKQNFKVEDDEGYLDDDVRVRFESVIDFPFFLLHTLKVLISINDIRHEDADKKIVDELLDDKKLIDSYVRVLEHGIYSNGKRISDNKKEFVQSFIVCLLRTRYLFDQFIIKREYANEDAEGEWSLKTLHVSGQQTKKKPYYKNTRIVRSGVWNKTNDERIRDNIMLQSVLRVSYTSPKVMHWITKLLIWLSTDDEESGGIEYYSDIIENIAKEAVKNDFLDNEECIKNNYAMGVNTPHIVFNYLDYLIWCYYDNDGFDDFRFEFRNSVEHWYPQHPSEGTFEEWKDDVDRFGNLCIVQRKVNSKFSNMSPEAKKSTYKDMIAKGSLKLRLMSLMTEKAGSCPASLNWKDAVCKQHEDEMLELLKDACNNAEG